MGFVNEDGESARDERERFPIGGSFTGMLFVKV